MLQLRSRSCPTWLVLQSPGAVGKSAVLCNFQAVQLDDGVVMADALLDAAQERFCHLTLELVNRGALVIVLIRIQRILQTQQVVACKFSIPETAFTK